MCVCVGGGGGMLSESVLRENHRIFIKAKYYLNLKTHFSERLKLLGSDKMLIYYQGIMRLIQKLSC